MTAKAGVTWFLPLPRQLLGLLGPEGCPNSVALADDLDPQALTVPFGIEGHAQARSGGDAARCPHERGDIEQVGVRNIGELRVDDPFNPRDLPLQEDPALVPSSLGLLGKT